jgi:predicted nuclease with TOPRIM domain
MNDDSVEAARRSLDPERLLPGEDLTSSDREDAAHWVQVYRELRDTKKTLAADLATALDGAGEVARAELEAVDMVLIRTQLDRFERRFMYWSSREQELNGVKPRRS